MSNDKSKNTADKDILQEIYKTAGMGTDAVITIMGKTTDEKMRTELTAQLEGFQNFSNNARNKLALLNETPKEASAWAKIPAEMSISMTTLMDRSVGKIAEMVINGTTMGIIDIQKAISKAKNDNAENSNITLASDILAFQQNNIDKMKTFL